MYVSLVGIASVQIIATASNFYLLEERLDKRTWALLWGGAFCFMLFIPNFRHYRVMSVFGLLTTTYVSWFMLAESLHEGRDEGVTYSAPSSVLDYFRGMVSEERGREEICYICYTISHTNTCSVVSYCALLCRCLCAVLCYAMRQVGILFAFGGHSSNIEVADVMDDPSAYDQCYFYSYLYVFTLVSVELVELCCVVLCS